MDIFKLAAELRQEIKRATHQASAVIAKLAAYSLSSADGITDKVQGYGVDAADSAPYDYDGRRIFPFGIRSRPPKGVEAVWIAVTGGSANGVIVGAESSRFGPSDLADGESCFYNKVNGCEIRLKADGSVNIKDGGGTTLTLPGDGTVHIGDGTLTATVNGVVVGSGIDPFTGATYAALGSASVNVMAKK